MKVYKFRCEPRPTSTYHDAFPFKEFRINGSFVRNLSKQLKKIYVNEIGVQISTYTDEFNDFTSLFLFKEGLYTVNYSAEHTFNNYWEEVK